MLRTCFLVVFCFFVTNLPSNAQTTITFDGSGLSEGDIVTNQFPGVVFSGAILGAPGTPQVGWNAAGGTQADVIFDAGSGFNGPFITDEFVDGSFSTPGTILIHFEKVADGLSTDFDSNACYNLVFSHQTTIPQKEPRQEGQPPRLD